MDCGDAVLLAAAEVEVYGLTQQFLQWKITHLGIFTTFILTANLKINEGGL